MSQHLDRPDLAPEQVLRPGEFEPNEHWIWRESPRRAHGGWYLIVQVAWKPAAGNYYVRIDRPSELRNQLADHFYLRPKQRVAVRRGRATTSGESLITMEGHA